MWMIGITLIVFILRVVAILPVQSSTTLTIRQHHFPLKAFIKIYDSNGIHLASTSSGPIDEDIIPFTIIDSSDLGR